MRDGDRGAESRESAVVRALRANHGWAFFVAVTLVSGATLVPLTWISSRFWAGAGNFFSDATHRLLRFYFDHLFYMVPVIEGRERRAPGSCLIVANHASFLDPLLLMSIEPRLGGPVRRYMLRVPVFGEIARLAGFFQSDVGELPSFEDIAASVGGARSRGGSVLFFPEGTRSADGQLGTFHRGAFRAAFDHDLVVQPVAIEGLGDVLPKGRYLTQTSGRYPVRMRYLDPIAPPFGDGVRRDVVRALTDRARAAIADALDQMREERRAGADRMAS
ncbi:MAG: lysophospholipid acyltransferase family protein [Myxococcota bacterium]